MGIIVWRHARTVRVGHGWVWPSEVLRAIQIRSVVRHARNVLRLHLSQVMLHLGHHHHRGHVLIPSFFHVVIRFLSRKTVIFTSLFCHSFSLYSFQLKTKQPLGGCFSWPVESNGLISKQTLGQVKCFTWNHYPIFFCVSTWSRMRHCLALSPMRTNYRLSRSLCPARSLIKHRGIDDHLTVKGRSERQLLHDASLSLFVKVGPLEGPIRSTTCDVFGSVYSTANRWPFCCLCVYVSSRTSFRDRSFLSWNNNRTWR